MDNYTLPEYPKPKYRLGAALLAGSMLIAACTERAKQQPLTTTPPEAPTLTTEQTTTTSMLLETTLATTTTEPEQEVPAEDCSFRFVRPGEHFNEDNIERLEEDLALLEKLHTDDTEVGLRDIATAGGIIRRSYQDPLYAEAFVIAKDAAQEGDFFQTENILDIELSQITMCDNNHLKTDDSRAQLQRTVSVAQTLSRRIGERIGAQTSAAVRQAFEVFENSVRELVEEMEDNQ